MTAKYELETIPVWDAYQTGGECPLCLLQRATEQESVRFYVGNSVMVPETRVQVNETGFCRLHYPMLLGGGNRLGLALITQTHIGELRRKLDRRLQPGKGSPPLRKQIASLGAFLTDQLDRCLICDRLAARCKDYAFTILHLWQHEAEFRRAFGESRGVCLDHLGGLLEMALETLKTAGGRAFMIDLLEVQRRAWDRLERELQAFSGGFDYRTTGSAAPAARQSLHDAIQKLTGAAGPGDDAQSRVRRGSGDAT